jgi:hypothetical protein
MIPQKTTKMEEEKGRFIAFDLKTRVGQPSDTTKYKKYIRKFKEGNPQEWIEMLRDLEEIWTQNFMASGTDWERAQLPLKQPSKMPRQQKRVI